MDCEMDRVYARRLQRQQQQSMRKEFYLCERKFENEAENHSPQTFRSTLFNSTKTPPTPTNDWKNGSINKTLKRPKYSDRYIPARLSESWQTRFSLEADADQDQDEENTEVSNVSNADNSKVYSSLLKNEILDSSIGSIQAIPDEKVGLFQYSPTNLRQSKENRSHTLSPLGPSSQRLLSSPVRDSKKISQVPFKVLDAPDLEDNFYLNLVDWSSQNILGVGLGRSVYLWSANTSQVTGLCELTEDGNSVTSISWNAKGSQLAVGTHRGEILIWDALTGKQLSRHVGHCGRIGTLAWNGDILTSGSRDRSILQRDQRIRAGSRGERRLCGHTQEVCGLEWSSDGHHLASGGNDNKLLIWSRHSNSPLYTFNDHKAAVKAVAWSPHHHGLLATGGGTADRTIRFWSTVTGHSLYSVDTGSQVCNLAWSKHSPQLISTHGYSQNQILLWNFPSMTKVAKLTGHSFRVLYLAVSPDGETIVTGAGDETLRFWNLFSKANNKPAPHSLLTLFTNIR